MLLAPINRGLGVVYRYDTTTDAFLIDEFENIIGESRIVLNLREYPITKITKCGVWIEIYGDKKFINLNAKKQWACITKYNALMSFRKRKEAQIRILSNRLSEANKALNLSKKIMDDE